AMNLPSLDKYEDKVKGGGVLVVNQSMVDRDVRRTDIKVAMVPANSIAEELGDKRMTNMVLLGALLSNLDILPVASVEKALKEHLAERQHKVLPLNKDAMQRGAAYTAGVIAA